MRVLIDIGHPAHVHFFREPIRLLTEAGAIVLVTSRSKECAIELLDDLCVEHICLSDQHGGGVWNMLLELVLRNFKLASKARTFKPDVMAGVGGIFVSQVGFICRIPSVVFYDTENAHAQNALTYPFATRVVVPECYTGWTPRKRSVRYAGYHELSYLHPDVFAPSRALAEAAGVASSGATYLVRVVAWKANHDVGEAGLSENWLLRLVDALLERGHVLISAEGDLPVSLERHRYRGSAASFHHVLAHCAGAVGESATVTSECAVLGVPAVYIANTSRGYIDEQSGNYGLVASLPGTSSAEEALSALDGLIRSSPPIASRRARLLRECVDVGRLVYSQIMQIAR